MSVAPTSRDGRTAWLIVLGFFVVTITLALGFFAFTGYMIDSGDRRTTQTQLE
ncbi:hypothetical protein [Microbacterium sp. NPDC077184]|uniref:hypothetical protein n=1 Tax=Microbacterium sp. NPDC077184 TaxID=3154764 RepID=UPI00341EEA29